MVPRFIGSDLWTFVFFENIGQRNGCRADVIPAGRPFAYHTKPHHLMTMMCGGYAGCIREF